MVSRRHSTRWGGKQGQVALESLRPGGKLLIYGRLSGEPYPLHNSMIMYRDLTITGFGINAWLAKTSRAEVQLVLEEAGRHIQAGRQGTVTPGQYQLKDYAAALESPAGDRIFLLRG